MRESFFKIVLTYDYFQVLAYMAMRRRMEDNTASVAIPHSLALQPATHINLTQIGLGEV